MTPSASVRCSVLPVRQRTGADDCVSALVRLIETHTLTLTARPQPDYVSASASEPHTRRTLDQPAAPARREALSNLP